MFGENSNNEFFEADIENAKLCSQPDCRRVAHHCSNLLDALLVFKSWFLQRQHEVQPAAPVASDLVHVAPTTSSPMDRRWAPATSTSTFTGNPDAVVSVCRPSDVVPHHRGHIDVGRDDVLVIERDWAVTRAKRAEGQMGRLRSACLAMRVQIEAGLRYKAETNQLRRELELTMDTIKHYKSIIDEGNRLREDLRTELARVRKDASVARAQLAASQKRRAPCELAVAQEHVIVDSRVGDEVSSSANTLLAANLAIGSTNADIPDGAGSTSFADKYSHLQRQTVLCERLKAEVATLKESLSSTLQKEVELSTLIDRCRSTVEQAIESVCEAGLSDRLARSHDQSLTWLSALACHLQVPRSDRFLCLMSRVSTAPGSSPAKPLPRDQGERGDLREEQSGLYHAGGGRKRKAKSTATGKPKKRSRHLLDLEPSIDLDEEDPLQESNRTSELDPAEEGSKLLEQVLSDLVTLEDGHSPVRPLIDPVSTDGEDDSSSVLDRSSGHVDVHSSAAVVADADVGVGVGDLSRPSEIVCRVGTRSNDGATEIDADLASVDVSPERAVKSREKSVRIHDKEEEELRPRRVHARTLSSLSSSSATSMLLLDPEHVDKPCLQSEDLAGLSSPSAEHEGPYDRGGDLLKARSSNQRKGEEEAAASQPTQRDEVKDDSSLGQVSTDLPPSLLGLLQSIYPQEVIDWFDLVTSDPCADDRSLQKGALSLTEKTHSRPELDFRQLCVEFLTESHLFSNQKDILVDHLLSNPSSGLSTLCQVYVEQLHRQSTKVDTSTTEARFIDLCRTLQAGSSTGDMTMLLADWSVDNCRRFHLASVVVTFFQSVIALFTSENPEMHEHKSHSDASNGRFVQVYFFRLIKTVFLAHPKRHFGLVVLPHLLNAASSHLTPEGPPSNPFILTLQALVAWQYVRLGQSKGREASSRKSVYHQQDVKVFERLRLSGWLDEAASSLQVPEMMQGLRTFALRLVDNCVKSRDREDSSGPALLLLLSATVLLLGDDAVVSEGQGQDVSGVGHQRARRRRQVQRQQRQGLCGWLITGRLLPWLEKLVKSAAEHPDLMPLLLLTTDLLVLVGYLFASCPEAKASPSALELRQIHTDSAHRLVTTLTTRLAASGCLPTCTRQLACLLRLFAVVPDRVMQAVLASSPVLVLPPRTVVGGEAVVGGSVSLLWPGTVGLADLVQHVLELLPAQPRLGDAGAGSSSSTSSLVPAFRTWCLGILTKLSSL